MKNTVVILGASNKKDRYAHKAQQRLMENGYPVIPVSADGKDVLGITGLDTMLDIQEAVDTVTLYVSPRILKTLLGDLLALAPRRVIFNPGTEDVAMQRLLADAGIHVVEACTLVLLNTGQFETA